MIWRISIKAFLITTLLLAVKSSVLNASEGSVSVSATVLSNNSCSFSPPGTATLSFGNLNPTNPTPVPATTTLAFRCGGKDPLVTYRISANDGQHFSGGKRRMRIAPAGSAYVPYELTLDPESATIPKTLKPNPAVTINGLITAESYQFTPAGYYTDQVSISIIP